MNETRLILEDKYESFLYLMYGAQSGFVSLDKVNLYTIRFAKKDGVNYKRLMEVIKLAQDLAPGKITSEYIFLEKHLEGLSKTLGLNNPDSIHFLNKKLTQAILSTKVADEKKGEAMGFVRYTVPHRILTEYDPLFEAKEELVTTFVVTYGQLQEIEENILDHLQGDEVRKAFLKLKASYIEDFMMSKLAFSDTTPEPIRKKILDQYEQITSAFLGEPSVRAAYRQVFDTEARLWIVDRLEALGNA